MRGAYMQYIKAKGIGRYTDAVEAVQANNKEAAELRLARIMNGAEPSHQNGVPPVMKPKKSDPLIDSGIVGH